MVDAFKLKWWHFSKHYDEPGKYESMRGMELSRARAFIAAYEDIWDPALECGSTQDIGWFGLYRNYTIPSGYPLDGVETVDFIVEAQPDGSIVFHQAQGDPPHGAGTIDHQWSRIVERQAHYELTTDTLDQIEDELAGN